jgi:hypothetical protein
VSLRLIPYVETSSRLCSHSSGFKHVQTAKVYTKVSAGFYLTVCRAAIIIIITTQFAQVVHDMLAEKP